MSDREQYIEIFNRATESAFEDHEAEWVWLLADVLRLPLSYSTAVYAVLKQGRWKDAENPKAYIITAAKREALKAEKPSSREIALVPTKVPIGYLRKVAAGDDKDDANPNLGGVTNYRSGGVRVINNGDEWMGPTDSEDRELPTFNSKAVPEYLCSLEDEGPDARLKIDWQKVYALAGVDEYERRILSARSNGLTAQEIFDSAPSDREERKLRAAYRRVDRSVISRVTRVLEGVAR